MEAPTTRELTEAEAGALRLARMVAAETMPYFTHALFAVHPVAAPGLGTFAVDRWWRLYLDPERLVGETAWSSVTAGAVLLHEVGHLLREHAARADALPAPYDHQGWNLAGDAEINDDLLAAGAALPEGVVTPAALGGVDGDVAENYYAGLPAWARTPAGQPEHPEASGEPGCGSGAGDVPVPGELGDPAGAGGGLDAAEADLVRRRVAADVEAAARATGGTGRGTVPAGLRRWATATLAPPTVSWSRLLRSLVRRAVADTVGRCDYTYSRPSRRPLPDVVRPAMRAPSVRVSVVLDTSGSMGAGDLAAAVGEVQGVLTASGVKRDQVRLIACDAAAGTVQRVRSAAEVDLSGGGGTDMRVGIDAALAVRPAPNVVAVLTDGYTPWPDSPPPGCAVVAGLIAPVGASVPSPPPWITSVRIPAQDGAT